VSWLNSLLLILVTITQLPCRYVTTLGWSMSFRKITRWAAATSDAERVDQPRGDAVWPFHRRARLPSLGIRRRTATTTEARAALRQPGMNPGNPRIEGTPRGACPWWRSCWMASWPPATPTSSIWQLTTSPCSAHANSSDDEKRVRATARLHRPADCWNELSTQQPPVGDRGLQGWGVEDSNL